MFKTNPYYHDTFTFAISCETKGKCAAFFGIVDNTTFESCKYYKWLACGEFYPMALKLAVEVPVPPKGHLFAIVPCTAFVSLAAKGAVHSKKTKQIAITSHCSCSVYCSLRPKSRVESLLDL